MFKQVHLPHLNEQYIDIHREETITFSVFYRWEETAQCIGDIIIIKLKLWNKNISKVITYHTQKFWSQPRHNQTDEVWGVQSFASFLLQIPIPRPLVLSLMTRETGKINQC